MTLAELSKKIGVSTATISRVLNDDGSVSAATKEKILHDLEAYGYQKRPRRKSSLVQNSDTALALIGKLTNPIAVAFLNGIHESLQAKGKRLLISVTDYDGVQELDALQYANRNGYCGVFLLNAVENPALISLLQDYPLPVVLVNRYLKALDLDVVTVDNSLRVSGHDLSAAKGAYQNRPYSRPGELHYLPKSLPRLYGCHARCSPAL